MKKIILSIILMCASTAVMAQERSTFIHMKSGDIVEMNYNDIDSITIGDPMTYDEVMEATYVKHIYYGGTSYSLHFSDKPITDTGLPTEAGQRVLRLYVFAEKSPNSNNAFMKSGRYVVGGDIAVGHIYIEGDYSGMLYCTGINEDGTPLGYMLGLKKESGALSISYEGDGSANVVFKSAFLEYDSETEYPENVMVTYNGSMPFDNQDPASYIMLTEDVNMQPTGLSGGYSNVEGMYGAYDLSFYNCELDESGFIIGPGELFNISLFTEDGTPMDVSKLAGEYTPTSAMEGPWEPGNYALGEMYDWYGMSMPIGCYYMTYGEGGTETRLKGFVTGGTLKITLNEDQTMMTVDADFTVEGGKSLTMNYTTATSNIIDRDNGTYMPARNVKDNVLTPLKRSNVLNRANTIKMVKK
ncbi:MAG: hypothetical protein IJ140_03905 [Prevotella sp.]|nr:hypothetical protein [Prevotella sp.]